MRISPFWCGAWVWGLLASILIFAAAAQDSSQQVYAIQGKPINSVPGGLAYGTSSNMGITNGVIIYWCLTCDWTINKTGASEGLQSPFSAMGYVNLDDLSYNCVTNSSQYGGVGIVGQPVYGNITSGSYSYSPGAPMLTSNGLLAYTSSGSPLWGYVDLNLLTRNVATQVSASDTVAVIGKPVYGGGPMPPPHTLNTSAEMSLIPASWGYPMNGTNMDNNFYYTASAYPETPSGLVVIPNTDMWINFVDCQGTVGQYFDYAETIFGTGTSSQIPFAGLAYNRAGGGGGGLPSGSLTATNAGAGGVTVSWKIIAPPSQ